MRAVMRFRLWARSAALQGKLSPVVRENLVLTDSIGFLTSRIHASGMIMLILAAIVQSLNLVVFAWFHRVQDCESSCSVSNSLSAAF